MWPFISLVSGLPATLPEPPAGCVAQQPVWQTAGDVVGMVVQQLGRLKVFPLPLFSSVWSSAYLHIARTSCYLCCCRPLVTW
jgi:hypothetical protein